MATIGDGLVRLGYNMQYYNWILEEEEKDDFQINQAYKKTCCLLQKTGFSLSILDKKTWQTENMHEFLNKPTWSASGLDKLIKKIDDRGGTEYIPY